MLNANQQIHLDFLNIYKSAGLMCDNIIIEPESKEYSACRFIINNKQAHFRVAKITPTKIGQFVTLWKRTASGPIAPYDESDSIDLWIISVYSGNHFGQFIFPKSVLLKQGILSKNGIGGKRAIRVYPPWDKAESKQATETQVWQLNYFLDLDPQNLNMQKIKALLLAA
ncbi:MAG: MepB family protein [Candidatus Dependentiae bacterium]|nr:MepB family protein [Candidatus Dependentiae bacterium]